MIEYNNSGVRLVDSGRFEQAQEMFRATLASKLASDSANRANCQGLPVQRCVTPDNYPSYPDDDNEWNSDPQSPVQFGANPPQPNPSVLSLSSSPSSEFAHGLYRHGFPMENDQDMVSAGAIVIFNMALVHQMLDAKSAKAGQFYQIAAVITAMEGFQPATLHQAIMNNLNVWSSDNDDSVTKR